MGARALSLLAFVFSLAWGQPVGSQDIALDTVMSEVQRALLEIKSATTKESLPPLATVTLTLQSEYKRSVGGGIKLFVISFGKKWEKSRSQELVLELQPPGPSATRPVAKSGVTEQLVEAILSGVRAAEAARRRQPPLEIATLKAEIGFVVEEKGAGGVKFEIVPVGADINADLTEKAVHKISVVFKRPARK